jgi:hypothetical protein
MTGGDARFVVRLALLRGCERFQLFALVASGRAARDVEAKFFFGRIVRIGSAMHDADHRAWTIWCERNEVRCVRTRAHAQLGRVAITRSVNMRQAIFEATRDRGRRTGRRRVDHRLAVGGSAAGRRRRSASGDECERSGGEETLRERFHRRRDMSEAAECIDEYTHADLDQGTLRRKKMQQRRRAVQRKQKRTGAGGACAFR